jgi:hypothetical protein
MTLLSCSAPRPSGIHFLPRSGEIVLAKLATDPVGATAGPSIATPTRSQGQPFPSAGTQPTAPTATASGAAGSPRSQSKLTFDTTPVPSGGASSGSIGGDFDAPAGKTERNATLVSDAVLSHVCPFPLLQLRTRWIPPRPLDHRQSNVVRNGWLWRLPGTLEKDTAGCSQCRTQDLRWFREWECTIVRR